MKEILFINAILLSACANSSDKSLEDSAADTGQGQLDTETDDTSRTDSGAGEDSAEEESSPPPNLLLNGSFESDEAWGVWGGAQRVNDHSVDGDWSLKATNGNGAEQLVEGLKPNTVYQLSGWGKSEGVEPMLIGVKYHGNAEDRIVFSDSNYAAGHLEFSTGLSHVSAVIYAYKHSGDGPGYADDLVLIEVGESGLEPVWSDEFDGSGPVDASKWSHEEGFVRNEEMQWYQADNAFMENGLLVIEGREEDKANPNYDAASSDWRKKRERISYSSASIRSKDRFDYTYGRLVVRAKVSGETGTWPAIWTLGVDCDWPSNGEVDVMENYGGDILANFAWGSNQPWSPVWDSSRLPLSELPVDWTDSFHIWEFAWSETQMEILLDGQVLNSANLADTVNGSAACAGQNPFQQPHYILLNLALGSNGGSLDQLSFPTRYLVDYVRLYQ